MLVVFSSTFSTISSAAEALGWRSGDPPFLLQAVPLVILACWWKCAPANSICTANRQLFSIFHPYICEGRSFPRQSWNWWNIRTECCIVGISGAPYHLKLQISPAFCTWVVVEEESEETVAASCTSGDFRYNLSNATLLKSEDAVTHPTKS